MSRCVVVFGQFGAAADPVNLPKFRSRLATGGIETILIQHDDSRAAIDFLRDYNGKIALVGASLGAMSAVIFAGYLVPRPVNFVGGFQPSDYDPSGHSVSIQDHDPEDLITRAIDVPSNVAEALCFRNPVAAMTGGLGHATYIAANPGSTRLTVVKRLDVHPGDFGEAADEMFDAVTGALE